MAFHILFLRFEIIKLFCILFSRFQIWPSIFFFPDMSLPVESCINIGDKVCVDLNTDTFKGLMQDYGGWHDDMEKVRIIMITQYAIIALVA